MSKQYGQNRRSEDSMERDREGTPVNVSARRREGDLQTSQLLWSFAVALCLILAAILQWNAPRNALMEQDRVPAQVRMELSTGSAPSGL